mgnify:CR=1 FL=1
MSRIGKLPIALPQGVELTVSPENVVTVKGPKGTLTRSFSPILTIEQNENIITVARPNEEKHTKQLHGTTRALLSNMVVGVSEGFTRSLELVGIGYRANVNGNKLTVSVGYSHPIIFEIEQGITIVTPTQTEVIVSGIDKQRVGEWAANIRATRKPEPYKCKGVRYKGEVVRRKEGKTAAKK